MIFKNREQTQEPITGTYPQQNDYENHLHPHLL
jgi:hypothetical protein